MRVATINECTVCLGWRTPMAVEAGVTDDDLAAVTDPTDPRFSPAERVALEYTDAVLHRHRSHRRRRSLARLGEHFDSGEIVELTLVIAKYLAMGRFMQVLGLDQACSLQMTTPATSSPQLTVTDPPADHRLRRLRRAGPPRACGRTRSRPTRRATSRPTAARTASTDGTSC